MGLLSAKQSVFVDKMSRLIVNESTDFDETSDDDELEMKQSYVKDLNFFTEKLVKSKEKTDQRFINLYRIRRAYSRGTGIGLEGLQLAKSSLRPTQLDSALLEEK